MIYVAGCFGCLPHSLIHSLSYYSCVFFGNSLCRAAAASDAHLSVLLHSIFFAHDCINDFFSLARVMAIIFHFFSRSARQFIMENMQNIDELTTLRAQDFLCMLKFNLRSRVRDGNQQFHFPLCSTLKILTKCLYHPFTHSTQVKRKRTRAFHMAFSVTDLCHKMILTTSSTCLTFLSLVSIFRQLQKIINEKKKKFHKILQPWMNKLQETDSQTHCDTCAKVVKRGNNVEKWRQTSKEVSLVWLLTNISTSSTVTTSTPPPLSSLRTFSCCCWQCAANYLKKCN